MKYIFVILISGLLFVSCKQPSNTSKVSAYDIASDAIDSIAVDEILVRAYLNRYVNGTSNGSSYYSAMLERYVFAKLYLMELSKIESRNERDKLMAKYNTLVGTDPNEFYPDDMKDVLQRAIFKPIPQSTQE